MFDLSVKYVDKNDIVVYRNVINLEAQFYNKFCEKASCFRIYEAWGDC